MIPRHATFDELPPVLYRRATGELTCTPVLSETGIFTIPAPLVQRLWDSPVGILPVDGELRSRGRASQLDYISVMRDGARFTRICAAEVIYCRAPPLYCDYPVDDNGDPQDEDAFEEYYAPPENMRLLQATAEVFGVNSPYGTFTPSLTPGYTAVGARDLFIDLRVRMTDIFDTDDERWPVIDPKVMLATAIITTTVMAEAVRMEVVLIDVLTDIVTPADNPAAWASGGIAVHPVHYMTQHGIPYASFSVAPTPPQASPISQALAYLNGR